MLRGKSPMESHDKLPSYPTPTSSFATAGRKTAEGGPTLMEVLQGREPTPTGTTRPSTSCSRRSRAKTCRPLESKRGFEVPGPACSSRRAASFAVYDRDTCCWRTHQGSFLDPSGWEPFSGAWPRSGTMRNGRVFRRPPWVRIISVIVSSSSPTPIEDLPAVDESTGSDPGGSSRFTSFPTPRAADSRGCGPLGSVSHKHRLDRQVLDATLQDREQITGWPNPIWMLWLQGFPMTWLAESPSDIESEIDVYLRSSRPSRRGKSAKCDGASPRSATASSPRSPTSSVDESSTSIENGDEQVQRG